MKKLLAILAALMALTLVLSLAGCAGNTGTASSNPDAGVDGGREELSEDDLPNEAPVEIEPGDSGSNTLNIFTWATYFPDDVLDEFRAVTGVNINYSNFESNEEMLTKLQAANGGDYDIILASDYIIDIARQAGLLGELDKDKIPNYGNIDPNFQSHFYDPENQYTIPYAAGTPLIVYDPAMVDIEITSYADLWNPALANSVVAMDDARNMIGITLKTMGQSFNTTDPDILAEAGEKLIELKPNIVALTYDNPQGLIVSGDATVGYMFSSQVMEATAARPDLKVVYPSEGMGFGIDSIFVPVNAPNPDNAHAFINFILDGEVGARISSQIYYLCANQAAAEFLPEEFRSNEALYIPSEVLGDTEFIQDVGEATELFDQVWTAFKQA